MIECKFPADKFEVFDTLYCAHDWVLVCAWHSHISKRLFRFWKAYQVFCDKYHTETLLVETYVAKKVLKFLTRVVLFHDTF